MTLRPLLTRLHFYAGILVGPFLVVAAVSGLLYALAPQVEPLVYRDQLRVEPSAASLPLADQVAAARAAQPGGALLAVRPAEKPGLTTRVLFSDPGLGESDDEYVEADLAFHRAVVTAAHNAVLSELFDSFVPRVRRAMLDMLKLDVHQGQHRDDQAEHEAIAEAIRARDPELAAGRSRSHLGAVRGSLLPG